VPGDQLLSCSEEGTDHHVLGQPPAGRSGDRPDCYRQHCKANGVPPNRHRGDQPGAGVGPFENGRSIDVLTGCPPLDQTHLPPDDDRRYGFMFSPPERASKYDWLAQQVLKLLMAGDGSGIKIKARAIACNPVEVEDFMLT